MRRRRIPTTYISSALERRGQVLRLAGAGGAIGSLDNLDDVAGVLRSCRPTFLQMSALCTLCPVANLAPLILLKRDGGEVM